MGKKAIAIIPARGGSKRIPRKNIKKFFGSPIISYSIKAAIDSGIFEAVMVSTDDNEIVSVAKSFKAEVPFLRSKAAASDGASLNDVIEEVLSEYKKMGKEYDYFSCILATAPFLNKERLKKAHELISSKDVDAVIPVVKFSYPIQRALKIDQGMLKMIWPENYFKMSNELEASYHDSGQFYFMKTASFLEQKRLFAKKTLPLVIPESEVQDVDTDEDWKMAEIKYKLMKNL